jgi:hypothetical protein
MRPPAGQKEALEQPRRGNVTDSPHVLNALAEESDSLDLDPQIGLQHLVDGLPDSAEKRCGSAASRKRIRSVSASACPISSMDSALVWAAGVDHPRFACIVANAKYWLVAVSCWLRNSMTLSSPFT